MLEKSIPLFRPFGVLINVHWTWLILATLIIVSLSTGWFPLTAPGSTTAAQWLAGIAGALGLFLSIIIHELCHAVVGRKHHLPMNKITLFLFGGVAHMEEEPPSPKAEFQMAIAGPLASFVLAGVFFGLQRFAVEANLSLLTTSLLSYLASINIIVAVFNLLPGFPLDGGRVLRSILWQIKNDIRWATRIASYFGQAFGFGLALVGVASIFFGQGASGLWSLFLGLLLASFARGSYVQLVIKQALHGKPVAIFMNPKPLTVHPETPVSDLMRESIRSSDQILYPVMDKTDQEFIGCVDLRLARQFPESQWREHSVSEITQKCSNEIQISPEADAEQALNAMTKTGNHELLVVEDNHLLGMVSQGSLIRYLSFREV